MDISRMPEHQSRDKPASVDGDSRDDRPRKKRRKYIARACNECKRRKIKCNGENPCYRCRRQGIDCVYVANPRCESTSEAENLARLPNQMKAMQYQIASLSTAVRSLTHSDGSPVAGRPRVVGTPGRARMLPTQRTIRRVLTMRGPPFQGPTTSAFSFDLAKSSLQRRGIVESSEAGEEGGLTQEPSPLASPSAPYRDLEFCQPVDPFWSLPKAEALRLCQVYEEEMGIMYPVLELSELLDHVNLLYGMMDHTIEQKTQPSERSSLDREDVCILRLVFACALTAEASGRSEQAIALFDTVRAVQDNCVWGPPEIKNIIFLTVVSIFYFQIDEETLAWRTIGLVGRMCLEVGLHRRETLDQPAIVAAGKDRILRLFWSIYILDKRWSFGTGMPFAIESSDIDPWLPEPEDKTPYLGVMIRYSRIAAKVWKFTSTFSNTNKFKKDEMDYLDWQILRWVHAIPDSLSLTHPSTPEPGASIEGPRGLRRLRALLYLRTNQLRMFIHRPVLHAAGNIMRYPAESETVVNIAKDTIRFITRLNEISDIYQLQQVAFNWFLVPALAVLFLAVSQAPTQFSASCKEEFYRALELVEGFSTQSYISRRLWRSIRSLTKLGLQLGLVIQKARPATETYAAGPPDLHGSPCRPTASNDQSQTPVDGAQMSQELMEWFEAVGNLEDKIMGVGTGLLPDETPWQQMPNGEFMFDYEGDLSSLMKDCF